MKRTKDIRRDRFRKVHTFWKVSMIAALVAGAFALTGCDNAERDVYVYKDIQDCQTQVKYSTDKRPDTCTEDYNQALRSSRETAPKFNSAQDCQTDFGSGNCTSYQSGSHMMWYPLMSGFSSRSGSYPAQSLYSSSDRSSSMYGKYYDSQGNSFGHAYGGKRAVAERSLNMKPSVTSTTTRGGFGSTVRSASYSSHSSGHSSSSSHSFGG